METSNKKIILKGVKVHNLKNQDLTLNTNELIVFTGVSGSGKSSLAFDTIYVEGQRRYIESLSHQARRHLSSLPKPEADDIQGIAPTIAIEQKTAVRTPRSTVGTMTGIYDFLRVLFARIGIAHCPISKEPVSVQSLEKIIAQVQMYPKKHKLIILAPFAKAKKGEFVEEFAELMAKGFTRVRIDGKIIDLSEPVQIDGKISHDIDIVIDRISGGDDSRIKEAVTLALDMGEGFFSVIDETQDGETLFSRFAYSKKSNLSYGPLLPHHFSFNHPEGMCPTCHGLGVAAQFDLEKIIDPEKSMKEDCCMIAPSYTTVRYGNIYDNLARLYHFKVKTPWKDLSEEAKHVFLHGTVQKWTKMRFVHPEKKTTWIEPVRWQGVLQIAEERLIAAKSDSYRNKMKAFMKEGVCPDCLGARIKPYPAETRLGGKKIAEMTALSLDEGFSFFESLKLTEIEEKIAGEILKEIRDRMRFLLNVGLNYLSLDRTSPTLSGGEAQRVRLASQIGAGLVGAIYVLDEPSIGLHPSDHHKLIQTLLHLRDQGNTVIVVEHDPDTILIADRIVDVGPGAGSHGGEILANGSVQDVIQEGRSITGKYLSKQLKIEPSKKKRKLDQDGIEIVGAKHHNLKNITVKIPLGGLICVTGVSGSGKSSLITETLYPALSNHFHKAQMDVGKHRKINGLDAIDKVISVDQSPIGRTPRSNAATYIKLFDEIRDLFASLPESKIRGFHVGHFSFNVKEGTCPYCSGLGEVKLDMDFMEDIWTKCPQCKGHRFDPDILLIQFKGKNILDILNMDVEHGLQFFDAIPSIQKKLQLLSRVGLDYLQLGQPSTTLSGGEAQRIKLAKELVRPQTGKTLYILDEPTTGLHFHDVNRLLSVLQALVDKGNTVLVIEHNLDFIRCSDWLIDIGPSAGIAGGELIGEGPPEKIAKLNTATGKSLADKLGSIEKKKLKISGVTNLMVTKAEQNNLKAVTLSIPRNQMTIFSGPSGSGKSSLAFETLYAEGQRRYTETLSPYARSLVKQLPKPKVEKIEGLSASIALEQKTGGLNPRSTVGTLTEIYDLLRVLYAHLGTAFDPETGEKIQQISKEYVVENLLQKHLKKKMHILAPIALKENFEKLIENLQAQGFLRIRLNGKYFELDEQIPFEKHRKNDIFLVIDRLICEPKSKERLFEAVQKAATFSDGLIYVDSEGKDLFFNLAFAVESTGKSYQPITPQSFSFNHQNGMCQECQGLGQTYGLHLLEQKGVLKLSILDLLDRLFKEMGSTESYAIVEEYFSQLDIDPEASLKTLSDEQMKVLLKGGPEKSIRLFTRPKKHLGFRWLGLETFFTNASRMANSAIKESLIPLMKASTCEFCQGSRLNSLSRNVRIHELSIADFCNLSLVESYDFIKNLSLKKKETFLLETKTKIERSLEFLLEIGLSYLSLSRSAPTLSGGELQRIRLARQLGSGLTSCLYILDEPTIGLHPHNNVKLNHALQNLKKLGNTLLLVEHDPMTVIEADYLFDFGPKAGIHGGEITAHGTIDQIKQNPHSLTGQYLSGKKKIPVPKTRRSFTSTIRIVHANMHNLKNLTVEIPCEVITCLTGISGSGKSTLMRHLLQPAFEKKNRLRTKKSPFLFENTEFYGLNAFDKLVVIDQSPIGQTSRADVSTYSDVQPLIRQFFATLPLAEAKGLKPSHFSPNHIRGMCKTCWGLGYKIIDLQFLPSVKIDCDVCHGNRLNPISLEVKYKGKHFGEILHLTVEEAVQFFSSFPMILKKLQTMHEVGLSYLKLNQEIPSLSGGEAQRLRLSRELSKKASGKTLYLIDEPTVGLHNEDIAHLLPIFHRLADQKNTLLIIEHNLEVIKNADYIIDLGPDAGPNEGQIIATGTPEEISKVKESKTAPFLKEVLKK